MWTSIAGGLVRTFGAALAGYFVAKGRINADDANTIVGAIGAAAVAAASAYDKVKRK
jgi:hypothetical protein